MSSEGRESGNEREQDREREGGGRKGGRGGEGLEEERGVEREREEAILSSRFTARCNLYPSTSLLLNYLRGIVKSRQVRKWALGMLWC